MITTGAMMLIGKTYGNLMVDVQINSDKLRDRARRIVQTVTGLEDGDEVDKVAEEGELEREGRHRHAEDRVCRTRKRCPGCARRRTRCAMRSAKISSRGYGS